MILGVDPGLTGAIGVINEHGEFVAVYDMPIYVDRNGKNAVDVYTLGKILAPYSSTARVAVVEDVHAMPRDGVVSAFRFGQSVGKVEGSLGVHRIPISYTRPAVWKSIMGVTAAKETSLEKVRLLLPNSSTFIKLKKHDGRAEALLLALFGLKQLHALQGMKIK